MHFAPWRNLGILFHQISVDLILNSRNLILLDWSSVIHSPFKAQIPINQKRFPEINSSHS